MPLTPEDTLPEDDDDETGNSDVVSLRGQLETYVAAQPFKAVLIAAICGALVGRILL